MHRDERMGPFRLEDFTHDMTVYDRLEDRVVDQLGARERINFCQLCDARREAQNQCVVAVICSNPRRDDKTGNYSVNISDLRSCIGTLMTIGWEPKFPESSVVLIIRPSVDVTDRGLQFTVKSQSCILKVAKVKFYGLCGAPKSNGEPCKMAAYKNGKDACFFCDGTRPYLGKGLPTSSSTSASSSSSPSPSSSSKPPSKAAALQSHVFTSINAPTKIQLTKKPSFVAMQDRFSVVFNPRTMTNERLAHVTSTADKPIPAPVPPLVLAQQVQPEQSSAAGIKRANAMAAAYTITTQHLSAPPSAATATVAATADAADSSSSSVGNPKAPLPTPHPDDVLGNALAPEAKRPRDTAYAATSTSTSTSTSGSSIGSSSGSNSGSRPGVGITGHVASLEGDDGIDSDSDTFVARGSTGGIGAAAEMDGRSYHRDGSVAVPVPAEFGVLGSDGVRRPRVPASMQRQMQPRPPLVTIQKVGAFAATAAAPPWDAPVGMASLASVDPRKQQVYKLVGGVLVNMGTLAKQGAKANAAPPEPTAGAAAAAAAAAKVKMNAEVKGLLNRKSKHANEAETTWFDEYSEKLDKMAKKEAQVEHVNKQHALTVNAFFCKSCNAHTEHLPSLCRKQGHTLVAGQTQKRFFECRHCKTKAYTLGEHSGILPKRTCACGHYAWIVTGFLGTNSSKNISELTGDKLVLAASNYNDRYSGQDAYNARDSLL